MKKSR